MSPAGFSRYLPKFTARLAKTATVGYNEDMREADVSPNPQNIELGGNDMRRFRVLVSLLLTACIGIGALPATVLAVEADTPRTATAQFADVPTDAYYADAVAWVAERNITNGTAQNTFSPEDPCTRAQAVTFLWRAAGCPETSGIGRPFADVSISQYYAKAVWWALEHGITNGSGNQMFSPDEACTRGQIVTFLWRAAGQPTVTGAIPFADVQAGQYYEMAVRWAVKNGITLGTSQTTFSPNDACTRGQIVTFLYRAYTN